MTLDASFSWIRSFSNPFVPDVVSAFDDVLPGVASSEDIHEATLAHCRRVLAELVPEQQIRGCGRTILIAAPRAGYGKTHLVARLKSEMAAQVTLLPIGFDLTEAVTWRNLLRRVVRHAEATPAADPENADSAGAGSLWQETGRRLFAEVFLSASRVAAEAELDLIEGWPACDQARLFDCHQQELAPESGSALREWILENSHRLTELAAADVCARWQIDAQILPMWMAAFRRSALEVSSVDERSAIQRSLIPAEADADAESQAKARLGEFLRMASACRPLALVVDHLDGFHGDRKLALPMANLFAGLKLMARRGVTLLCMNRDLWLSIFEGALPSALADRMNGEPAALGKITVAQARSLVKARMAVAGIGALEAEDFADLLAEREDWRMATGPLDDLYPRGVLRCAGAVWESLLVPQVEEESGPPENATQTSAEAPVLVPAPVIAAPVRPEFPPPVPPESDRSTTLPLPFLVATKAPPGGLAETRFRPAPAGLESSADSGPMTDLQSIVADIRSGGALAVSEGPSPDDVEHGVKERFQRTVATPESAAVNGRSSPRGQSDDGDAAGAVGGSQTRAPSSPQAAATASMSRQEMELRQRVAGYRKRAIEGALPWIPLKIERLVREIGSRFPAVAQTCPQLGGQSCVRWRVRGRVVLLGFARPGDEGFWRRMSKRTHIEHSALSGEGAKAVAFFAKAAEKDFSDTNAWRTALAAQGTGADFFDVIELHDDDLALLYAGDDLILESGADIEERVRFVARRMDPFWRRVTRPEVSSPVS